MLPHPGRVRASRIATVNPLRLRAIVYQAVLATMIGLAAWYLASTAARNLMELGVARGFGFLWRESGFAIGETTFLSYSPADTYLRALLVGVLNTLCIASLAIIFSTLAGVLVGLARLSSHWLLENLAAGYIEILRNVPLVVQLFFWYALITENLPAPAEAWNLAPGIWISNRGIAFPLLTIEPVVPWLAALAAVMLAGIAVYFRAGFWAAAGGQWAKVVAAAGIIGSVAATFVSAPLELDYPQLGAFNFAGGGSLSPEFTALLLGLSFYTAAFIAEIVRAGFLSVERGQVEAGYSLGLRPRQVLRFIVAPQALRLIVPPLTSQYLNCTKNSSLAIAIGYPDLVSIANTTINQTGQAIEGFLIIMSVYLTFSLAISLFMSAYNRRVALRGNAV
jgi:general L-amino acid transport system permease protein